MKSDMKRKVKQILHANGFVDLTEIVEIKCLKNDGKTEEDLEENLDEVVEGEGCLFKLLLKNGGVVSLKVIMIIIVIIMIIMLQNFCY